jgi:GTP-binding protein HflX
LVAAFKSTLQEAAEADLLLHVIDAHSETRDEIISDVNQVLIEIKADKIKRIEVYNKIDLLDKNWQPRIDRDEQGTPVRVWLSAEKGDGVELLLTAISEVLRNTRQIKKCRLRPDQGEIRAKLFSCAKIIAEHINSTGESDLVIEIDNRDLGLLKTVDCVEVEEVISHDSV